MNPAKNSSHFTIHPGCPFLSPYRCISKKEQNHRYCYKAMLSECNRRDYFMKSFYWTEDDRILYNERRKLE